MKNLLFFIALLFTVICFAEPPTETKVFKPDKTFVVQANDVVNCPVKTTDFVMVREVTSCRKFSVSTINYNTALTEQNSLLCIVPLIDIQKIIIRPIFIIERWRLKENPKDLQNSNYGYPLSAN